MTTEPTLKEVQREWHGTFKSYAIGFIISILLTITSFSLAIIKPISPSSLTYVLIGLALLQACVQLLFFLHVGQEEKPYWEMIALGFTGLILLIIVIGSLWVMNDLDQRMMPDMKEERVND